MRNKIIFSVVALLASSESSIGQYWKLASNSNSGVDQVTSQSLSTFGTDNTVGNYNLKFQVQVNPAMTILYNNSYVGIVDYSSFSPNNPLEIRLASSTPQLRLAYDGTHYAEFRDQSTGDLIVNPQGSSNQFMGVGPWGSTNPLAR